MAKHKSSAIISASEQRQFLTGDNGLAPGSFNMRAPLTMASKLGGYCAIVRWRQAERPWTKWNMKRRWNNVYWKCIVRCSHWSQNRVSQYQATNRVHRVCTWDLIVAHSRIYQAYLRSLWNVEVEVYLAHKVRFFLLCIQMMRKFVARTCLFAYLLRFGDM